jgi:hypothetical protein
MEPAIQNTEFGSITVDDERYEHDVVIRLSGRVKKRKKRLSKRLYGTSHKVSLDEAKDLFEKGAKRLIIGSGQYGNVALSDEVEEYFRKNGCAVKLFPTPKAVKVWNEARGNKTIGMFHVTC